MSRDVESRLLCCSECGHIYSGSTTTDDDLTPDGTASGGRCHECGGEKFERVTIRSIDSDSE